MTIRHGRNAAIFVNGVDVSGQLNAVNPTSEQELADVTTFVNVGHTMYPGLAKDTATIEAIYDDTERAVFEGMVQISPSYTMMIAFGSTVGDPSYATNEVMLKSNNIKSVVTDVNRASINVQTSNYPFEAGTMLSAGNQSVGVASTGNGTTVDNTTASGTTGGAAYLHVFSVVGGTLTVTIKQSSTGAFAGEETAIASFSAASTNGTQRVAITSQIYRYARAQWVGATSTSKFATTLVRY